MRILIEDSPATLSRPETFSDRPPQVESHIEALDGGAAGAGSSSLSTGVSVGAGDDGGAPPAWLLDAVNAAISASAERSGDAPGGGYADPQVSNNTDGAIGEDAGAGPV